MRRMPVAEHGEVPETPVREDTYHSFMVFLKWGTVITALLTAFVIWLIAG